MKVDPNQVIGATFDHGARTGGIPLRLHIATSLGCGLLSNVRLNTTEFAELSENFVAFADALIAAHNETCEVEHE